MVHVLDLVKMEKPDVRRKKCFSVYVYNYLTSPGHVNTPNTYTQVLLAGRTLVQIPSPVSPLKQMDVIIYSYSHLPSFSFRFPFLFVFVGKQNQRGALHSVLNTDRNAVTCSSAKNKQKLLCEPPYATSPLVQPHHVKIDRLSKNLVKFQYNFSMRNLCRCPKQLIKLFLTRFKPLILSDTATIFSRFCSL